MNLKYLLLVPILALTACTSTVHKDPVHNPQSLNNDDLIKTQIAKLEQMQRDMEIGRARLNSSHT